MVADVAEGKVGMRLPFTVTDITPGDQVAVSIWDAATPQGCDQGGTSGTLTIEH